MIIEYFIMFRRAVVYTLFNMFRSVIHPYLYGILLRGITHPIRIVVDKMTIIDFINEAPYTPLFSITLYNDGPDQVYVSINFHQKTTPLKPGEMLSIDLRSPKIERIYLDVDEGKIAIVRGFGLY